MRTKDMEAMKILFEAVHNESPRLYSPAALKSAIENEGHKEVERLRQAERFLQQVIQLKNVCFHKAASRGDMELVKFFLGIGVDADIDIFKESIGYQTALAVASAGGHLDVMEYLISIGARLNPPFDRNRKCWDRSPLTAASEEGMLEAVEVLLQAGANVDGDLGLYAAVSKGHLLVARCLLEAGSDANLAQGWHKGVSYGEGNTPLEAAIQGANNEVVAALLEERLHLRGRVPYSAAEKGFFSILQRLIDAGAEINVRAI
ncbi:hypothetical protein HYALB_00009461 [Hymenoscyphus albidus]|uniref:Ankyrin n=1 Tax=Hymenoscyphus albidus TaxID=595503 RepID=A0A9N9Q3S9_9HELO|nr:hypothetical protein HYALB_00009461 [Hymenoscyphus albidus]